MRSYRCINADALTVWSRLAVAKTAVFGLNFKSLISRSWLTMRATMLTSKEIDVPPHNVTRPAQHPLGLIEHSDNGETPNNHILVTKLCNN